MKVVGGGTGGGVVGVVRVVRISSENRSRCEGFIDFLYGWYWGVEYLFGFSDIIIIVICEVCLFCLRMI